MIPRLHELTQTQQRYINFIEALKHSGFTGDLNPDYANRVVLATDNSIYQVLPQGIIYPKTNQDVVVLCELAGKAEYRDIVLSPRGGGTGTNGQSLTDGLVVDMSRHMNQILEINPEQRWVRVQSGVVKDQLNAALKPYGLFFAPELSTSNRATIGGMINTDASGQGSCIYGKTRNHVLELKTVILDGTILNTQALTEDAFTAHCDEQNTSGQIHRIVDNIYKEHHEKINEIFPPLNRCLTGYDLAHIRDENAQFNLNNILCGSEGTLGFICEAKLHVLPIPKVSALIVVKYADFQASLRDAGELMHAQPASIETIDSKVLNLAMNDIVWHQVKEFFDDTTEQPVQGINLVEILGDTEEALEQQLEKFKTLLASQNNTASNARLGYAVAWGRDAVNRLWGMRKRAVGLLGNAKGEARPIPFVEDTAVPPENLADFIFEFRAILDSYNLQYGMFGHVDAGVLHVRPALDMKDPAQEKIAWEISDKVADLTQKYNGLLWGEHGKGVRSGYALQFFGELYPQLQRIKAAFDPHNQLNPGKIATPAKELHLLAIDEVPTRGQHDRTIPVKIWDSYSDAVYCNGNGACFNWNPQDAMCPSWKATRERTQSPKGRASLIREWLRLLAEKNSDITEIEKQQSLFSSLKNLPNKLHNSWRKTRGDYDFSNEVYTSMAGCLACKSCAGQCPIKVNVPEFRSQFLSIYHTRYLRPLKDYLVSALESLLPYCAKVPKLYNGIMKLSPVRWLLDKVAGFVDGPLLTGINLNDLNIPQATSQKLARLTQEEKAKTVIIVQDAFTSYFETKVVIDICVLLKTLGFTPMLAPYLPNGKPQHVHGFLKTFQRTAEKNARMLNALQQQDVALVGIDPSMTLAYQGEYPKYLTREKAPNVQLIQDWLSANLPEAKTLNEHADIKTTVKTYYLMSHCTEQSNAAGSVNQWKKIYQHFGLRLETLNTGCCGMAGTYGHESRNRATSKKIYDLSWRDPVAHYTDATKKDTHQLIATGFSCRSQIKREDQKRVPHPLQALAEALQN